MSIETDVYAALSGAAGVTALIGTRIYPNVRPQDSDVPCVVFDRSGTEVIQSIHGPILATIARVDVTAVSATRAQCESIADAVVGALVAAGFNYHDRVAEYVPDADAHIATIFCSKPE